MASIVNKVKETLLGYDDSSKTTDHNTASTHNAPADPHRGTAQHAIGGTGTTGYDKSTDPHHKSNITGHDGSHTLGASGTAHTGTSTGLAGTGTNAGPHSSNAANKLDPRVDSDRDGSTALGTHALGHTGTHHPTGHTGTHHPTGHTGTYNTTTSVPHSSNVANKLDPRVDSDRDGSTVLGSHNTGHTGHTGVNPTGTYTSGHTGTHHPTGHTGTHHSTGHTGAYNTTTSGPHSSNIANKLDPRVDSDSDDSSTSGSRTTRSHRTGTHTTGHTGTHHPTGHTGTHHSTGHTGAYNTTTSGPHSSLGGTGTHTGIHAASGHESAKPHPIGVTSHGTHTPALNSGTGTGATTVSHVLGTHSTGSHVSGTHSTGSHVSGTHSHGAGGHHHTKNLPGPAPNTAGPHKSDILNKLDPRVDSDLDGSKTVGGNKTYQSDL